MSKDKSGNWFKRHKIVTGLLAIAVVIIIASIASGGGKSTNTKQPNAGGSPAKSAAVASINQPANDGKFQFTVASVQCGQASVGSDQYLTKTAQGQYCLLDVTVKNIGNEAQTFDASNQYLHNAQGQKYSADSEGSFDANPSGSTFLQSINPGNSVTGIVAFDIPKDVVPTTAELHDSAFSGGVKVNLQ